MKPVPFRIARVVSIAALTGVALSTGGCGDESAEIRTRCDGPNMIYEAWVDEPGDIGLEFRELYVVANDPEDDDAIWITEVWNSKASHQASLSLPAVRDAITRAKPLIAGFEEHIVTAPVGGFGLAETGGGD